MIHVIEDFKALLIVHHGKEQGQKIFHQAIELCRTSLWSMNDVMAYYRRTNEIPTTDEAKNFIQYNLLLK